MIRGHLVENGRQAPALQQPQAPNQHTCLLLARPGASDPCVWWRFGGGDGQRHMVVNTEIVRRVWKINGYARAYDDHGVVGAVEDQLQALLDKLVAHGLPACARVPRLQPNVYLHVSTLTHATTCWDYILMHTHVSSRERFGYNNNNCRRSSFVFTRSSFLNRPHMNIHK